MAYGIVLTGEEIFDVMQRDSMADEDVSDAIRRTSYIHVVEESRNMALTRANIRDRMRGASRISRSMTALQIATGTHVIAKSLIKRRVYEGQGVDWASVKHEIDNNEHHRMMFRRAAAPFIEFPGKKTSSPGVRDSSIANPIFSRRAIGIDPRHFRALLQRRLVCHGVPE